MIIIGITGTLGAGKGTMVDYLVQKRGFAHFSVRTYLQREMKKRNMPDNRDSMTTLANELRAQNSPSFITDETPVAVFLSKGIVSSEPNSPPSAKRTLFPSISL